MKKISVFLYVSSVILALSFFASGFSVLAKSNELTSPGLTPDSYFYFLDTIGEKVNMFFTFSPEKKAEKALGYAEERVAEAKVMAEENKPQAAEEAADGYKNFLDLANAKVEEAKEDGKDVGALAERIAETTLKHYEVLVRVFNQVPEEAEAVIQKVMETSIRGSKAAAEYVSDERKEELIEKIEETKSPVEEIILEEIIQENKVIKPEETVRPPLIKREVAPPEAMRQEIRETISPPPAQPPVIELPALEQKIRITSPNGGEEWMMGNTYTIKWAHPGNISGFYVDLYKGGVYMAGLGGFGARPGIFLESPASWEWNTIDTPNFEAGTDFKIRVKSSADNAIYDESDNYFSIAAPAISPTTCDYLKNNSANNRFFESCRKGSYDQICFDKYYSTYQGCGRSFEYGGCVVNNMNADKNIECDTGLVYTCKDSENLATRYGMKSDYNTQGTVTDAGKTYLDYCVDGSTLKEYSCVVSDIFPSGISREENYLCPNGCLNGACK